MHAQVNRQFESTSLLGLLHLSAAFTLAVAHPVYDLLSREAHAPFFTAHQTRSVDIAVLVICLSLLLPTTLWLVVGGIRFFSKPVSNAVFSVVLAILIAAALMPAIASRIPEPALASLTICGFLALMLVAAYWKFSPVRSFFSFLSLAVVAAPLLFLFSEPVRTVATSAKSLQGATASAGRDHPNIVMIVFDEFPLASILNPNLQIDPVCYPNFASLQATSTWFRNTLSAHYATTGAIASLLVGGHYSRYITTINRGRPAHSAGLNREKAPFNLFSLLEPNYRIHAIELTSKLAPQSQRVIQASPGFATRMASLAGDTSILYLYWVLPAELHRKLPPIGAQWKGFGGELAAKQQGQMTFIGAASPVGQFIELFENDFVPTVYYLHLMLPHYPFVFTETGLADRNRFPFVNETFRTATGDNHWPSDVVAGLVQQAHLFQVGFTDLLLGTILDRLKALGMFDDALILVTADHGTSFFWNDGTLTAQQMMAVQASETLQVPLFIKWPGQTEARIVDGPAQTIDVLPTIADTLALEPGWHVQGVSLLDPLPENRVRSAFIPDFRELPPQPDGQPLALRQRFELFGSDCWEPRYHLGPGRDLIGLSIQDVATVDSRARFFLQQRDAFEDVQPSTGHVPAYVEGEIQGWPESLGGKEFGVAIAVNGTIVNTAHLLPYALSELRKDDGGLSSGKGRLDGDAPGYEMFFLSRVPPSSLRTGHNDVAVLLFETADSAGAGGTRRVYRLTPADTNDESS